MMEKLGKEAILLNLNQDVMQMLNLAIESIYQSMEAFLGNDKEKARKVIVEDIRINELENKIEQEGLACLALYQPEAKDLRYVVGVLKMITDIERIGDLAANISQATLEINHHEDEIVKEDLQSLYRQTIEMVQLALDAFLTKDIIKAKSVLKVDDLIDEITNTIFKETMIKMCGQSQHIKHYIQNLLVSRHLERIGDHTTNIAEHTIFIYGGVNVKHIHAEDDYS